MNSANARSTGAIASNSADRSSSRCVTTSISASAPPAAWTCATALLTSADLPVPRAPHQHVLRGMARRQPFEIGDQRRLLHLDTVEHGQRQRCELARGGEENGRAHG